MTSLIGLYNQIEYTQDFPSEGVRFADIFPLLSDGTSREWLGYYLTKSIPGGVDTIVAPEVRGLLLGYLTSGYKVIPIRKKGKLPHPTASVTYDTEYSTDTIECNELELGNCWFIDDIGATYGTYNAVKEIVEKLGGTLKGGTVLLDVLGNKPEEVKELFEEVKSVQGD